MMIIVLIMLVLNSIMAGANASEGNILSVIGFSFGIAFFMYFAVTI